MPNSIVQGIAVHTRDNWPIPNETCLEKNAVSQLESIRIWQELRPNARLRSITAKYNCMGMVFASRRTHIMPQHLKRILKDDGYRKVADNREVELGDLAVYSDEGEVTHVGIVVSYCQMLCTEVACQAAS